MRVWSESYNDNERIPDAFAFGTHNVDTHFAFAGNKNPHVGWADLPEGTKSLVILLIDTEVPSKGDDVNQEGRTVPYELPRVDFFHWVLVDLDPALGHIHAGAFSDGITKKGKAGPAAPLDTRQGKNDYTSWFAGNPQMEGAYFGYDGPAAPWNDERMHRYTMNVYALDVERCDVDGDFDGGAVQAAMEGHVLASASFTGTHSIYPGAR